MFDSTIRTFISYSHDSPEHQERVANLAQRLRDDGVDCTIDQFPFSPAEGWPTWMDNQIRDSKFVLVVCSHGYHEKLAQKVAPNKGLGVKWEGAIITNELYASGGMNTKFIPLTFGDLGIEFFPSFLRQATRYDVSTEDGFESLYRHLTNQPRIEPRPLGSIRRLEPSHAPAPMPAPGPGRGPVPIPVRGDGQGKVIGTSDEILLLSTSLGMFVVPASEISSSDTVTFELLPPDEESSAFLSSLSRSGNHELAVSYGNKAALCRVVSVKSVTKAGIETVTLVVKPVESDYGVSFEMATSIHTADAIAEMRARRILLNERTPSRGKQRSAPSDGEISDPMLEVLIRGVNVPLAVPDALLPELYESLSGDHQRFLLISRLVSVLYLRLSGAVERIVQLDLSLSGDTLSVVFEGVRTKKYSNAPAHRMQFQGSQNLASASAS